MSVHDEPFEAPKPDKMFTLTATITIEAVDLAEARQKLADGDYDLDFDQDSLEEA